MELLEKGVRKSTSHIVLRDRRRTAAAVVCMFTLCLALAPRYRTLILLKARIPRLYPTPMIALRFCAIYAVMQLSYLLSLFVFAEREGESVWTLILLTAPSCQS